ncbi:MAG: leucine--tRNA ligase [Deltaproteobacteria bacterium]|nr:leucine--tRNA ligase [Deltaproteobacteria bacterium]
MKYEPSHIESKWQQYWEQNKTFEVKIDHSKPKYYVLDMFPYPSSSGLHVGHPESYTATDIIARYKRTKGFNVLHPMGWDAFGLPAEQYALQTGIHPAIITNESIKNFKKQLKMLGFSYDWSREISTCNPNYYRWTQYLFLKLYKKGLAQRTEVPVNWCPELKTVLANEEVIDGKSERGEHPVYRIPTKQWILKITTYAERLLNDLDKIDWPESTKELQRNWIGKSEGLSAIFTITNLSPIASGDAIVELEIFTSRPDTIFGVTFMVLAPEHPLVEKITTPAQQQAIKTYKEKTAQKSELLRNTTNQEKTGEFTGAFAINPYTHEKIPIWIADYVLMSYGTGAIMAVPAHDERDFEFAKKFNLPIKTVIQKPASTNNSDEFYSGKGICINSGFITGMDSDKASENVIAWAVKNKKGKHAIHYKLRDWLFSRQRYWGEPFPILHLPENTGGTTIHALDPDELPVLLPDVKSYEPSGTGESPLASIPDWVNAKRETDTMPGSAGSSWYFLRYCDSQNSKEPWSFEAQKYWMPVDFYLGGAEHAVGHLLYARFWTKVFYDLGMVSCDEPFKKLTHQGMILGDDGEKMSKSRGNVINPDEVVKKYGADALRLYEMFMGPLDKDKPWSTTAIEGVYRFLHRVWRVFVDEEDNDLKLSKNISEDNPSLETFKIFHQTIKKVTEDIENCRFNTAISQMMIFINHMTALSKKPKLCLKPFVQLLNPFAPHLAEELWVLLDEKTSLSFEPWPAYDPELAKEEKITVAIQVMGKTRGTIAVERETDQQTIEKLAKGIPAVNNQLTGKETQKVIFVKDKIINFIVKK